jgi:hypothetical protein
MAVYTHDSVLLERTLNFTRLERISHLLVPAFCCFFVVSCGCLFGGPSDAALQKKFFRNESQFNKLAQMSNEDWHVARITSGFTWLDTDASWPRSNIGFSPQRWNQYRELFSQLGISGGLSRRVDYPGTIFLIDCGSGVLDGTDKGYAYSLRPLSPVVQSLDHVPPNFYHAQGHAIAFKQVANNWYLYREED